MCESHERDRHIQKHSHTAIKSHCNRVMERDEPKVLPSIKYLNTQSCPTLCDPMDQLLCDPMDHHAPLSMGFSRQEYWSGLSPALAGGFFTIVPPGKPPILKQLISYSKPHRTTTYKLIKGVNVYTYTRRLTNKCWIRGGHMNTS